jgi:hypothetical protein
MQINYKLHYHASKAELAQLSILFSLAIQSHIPKDKHYHSNVLYLSFTGIKPST